MLMLGVLLTILPTLGFGGVYELVTKSGVVYRIDAVSGDLLTVTDSNENKLTFSDAGIVSSTGVEVTFERDAAGRIVGVADPEGNRIGYEYDGFGDLVAVTDREDNTTRFVYDADDQPPLPVRDYRPTRTHRG